MECANSDAFALRTPPRVTTLAWDDQLRRCLESDLAIVACSSSSASAFADELATGAYKVTYAFGGGQTQTQAVKDGKPAWIVSGVADYDPLGRVSRGYKIRFLPSACPQAGSWCDSIRIVGDPLRSDTAAIQIAYDAQGRVIRTYGPGWPRCDGDPSAVVQDSNGRPTGELKCDPPYKAPQVNDVTKFSYPAPGDTIAIDANNVPTLTHQDTRGLITLFQEYVLPPSTAPPGTPPTWYSAVSSTYDQLGRLVGTRDQNNNASLNTYDALSRLRTSTDPDLGLTAYEYNLRSQLIDRFAASGEKTHHEYDAIGRLTQTDYLRPRLVPGGASPTPNPSAVIPWPVPWCYVGADMSEPIRFGSVGPGPDPPPELETVSLAGSDANVGQVGHAQIELPFDLTIRTTAQVSGGASSLRVSTHEHRFLRGTTLVVRTTGQIRLGGSSIAAPQSARGRVQRPENPQATLDVLTTPSFTLAKDGLRYGVFGESGSRRLVIEWAGTLSERTESMLARATITEGNSIIRYDYVRVPPSAVKGAGIRLVDGASKYIRTLEPGRAGASPVVGSQASFSFGDLLGALAIRIKCDQLPDGGLEVPFTAGPAEDASLQFAYRVFNPCGKNDPAQCGGDLLIGYRDTAGKSGDIHPLTVVHYAARDLERSKNLDHEIPDVVSFPLPKKLQGKTFNLLVQPKFAAVNRVLADKVPFIFDFIWPGRTQTVYDTEERVYRAYDSSEPPYYIDTRADGSKFETKPLLDLTFDIPGFPVDRSPTRASFDDKTCPLAAMPLNSVQSVSGRGLTIPPGLECDGNIKSSSVPTLSAFTVELWVRKKMACQPPSCPRQAVFRAPGLFSIDLLTDGRIGCTVGFWGRTRRK